MKKNVSHSALGIVRRYFPGVQSVVDGHKPLEIEVTPKDSSNSTIQDAAACALAMACKRAMKADGVIVGISTVYVVIGKRASRYKLLESASREIVSFDRKGGFSPGIYRLRIPGQSEQLGEREGKGATSNPTGRRRNYHVTTNIRARL